MVVFNEWPALEMQRRHGVSLLRLNNRSVFRGWRSARSWIGYHLRTARPRLPPALPVVLHNGEPKRMAVRKMGDPMEGGLGNVRNADAVRFGGHVAESSI